MKNKFGKIGLIIGTLSILIVMSANYAYISKFPNEWFFLSPFDAEKNYLYSISSNQEWELKASPVFPISEENMIILAYVFTCVFGSVAIICSVIAEMKSEYTLYSESSLMLGSASVILINKSIGYLLLILVFIGIMYLRKKGNSHKQV